MYVVSPFTQIVPELNRDQLYKSKLKLARFCGEIANQG